MTKKWKKRASADVGLMLTAYNFRRIINILGKNVIKKFLKELGFLFVEKTTFINEKLIVRMIPIFENKKSYHFLRAA
jgi:hypothetical protein